MLDDPIPVMLGLASAFSWGSGDFVGGLASKHSNVLTVVTISQIVGLATLALLGLLVGEPPPDTGTLLWSSAAGLAGGAGLIALYSALAMGEMGVVAPVTGVVTAAVPVVFGISLEGFPTLWQFIGFLLAIGGVGLVTGFDKFSTIRAGLVRGLLAGIGFGLFLVFIGQVGEEYFFWPLTTSRCVTVAASIALAVVRNTGFNTEPKVLPLLMLGGLLDSGGSGFFLLARHATRLDISAVLSSLYPIATVMLAYIILKEKPTPTKTAGIALAMAAIPLIKS
ncbi:MAG: EamA family transporter [Nitrososphaerota archaeon]